MTYPLQSRGRARRVAGQLAAIARATFTEAIQEPVAFLLLASSVLLTLLVPVFDLHRFGEDGRLARDSGLSCMLVFGLVLAAGTAGRTVAGEIARGTAAAAIGKPVARMTFVLAKWLGVTAVVAVFWTAMLCATMLAERCASHFVETETYMGQAMDTVTLWLAVGGVALALVVGAVRHYVWRSRFGVSVFVGVAVSQAAVVLASGFYNRLGMLYPVYGEAACCGGHGGHDHGATWLLYRPEVDLRVLPVALLVLFALVVFAALATALATRMTPGAALAVCAGVLVLGLAGDSLWAGAPLWSARGWVAGLLPDVQNFWLCDALARGGRLAWRYVAEAGLYALTCCALFLAAGCLAFQERDLG